MNRDEKTAAVAEIAEQIDASEAIFAIDYRGISVPQAAELRSKLRESDASFRVVKNRLTKLAADQAKREELKDLLEGPTALTFVKGDTAAAAKAITTFNREHEVLTFKGGFMADTILDADRFTAIAKLPSRDVLNGQFAGVVASPLTGLVRGLGSMIQGLALQLGQIAEQGLVTGEAPAAEPEAPAETEDAPAEDAPAEDAPAEEAPAEQAEEDAPAEEQPEAEAPSDEPSAEASDEEPAAEAPDEEPAKPTGTPGGEAEDVSADENESPSEEASTSDASPTNSGDEETSETTEQSDKE